MERSVRRRELYWRTTRIRSISACSPVLIQSRRNINVHREPDVLHRLGLRVSSRRRAAWIRAEHERPVRRNAEGQCHVSYAATGSSPPPQQFSFTFTVVAPRVRFARDAPGAARTWLTASAHISTTTRSSRSAPAKVLPAKSTGKILFQDGNVYLVKRCPCARHRESARRG